MEERMYVCIDLKSFYASVECVERGLDPFTENLVVADPSRGSGAICLAVSPAMKSLGVRNRCRIFEIPAGMKYIIAMPRMKLYMKRSADIYSIYLKYVSSEDIHVYSVDECFIDVTPYLKPYRKTAREMALMLMEAVRQETGICATAGVGTNLFLAKVALDITAKRVPDHIGYLDEEGFRRTIWHHTPITDIWNVGRGIANRLKRLGAVDMYDVAHMNEELLFKEFGVNARYLIDHSQGIEPCTMQDIHAYRSESHSVSNSQILFENYKYDDALLVLKEMVDTLILELVDKCLVAGSISLSVGYSDDCIRPTGGIRKLDIKTNSCAKIIPLFEQLFRETTAPSLLIRRIGISFNDVEEDSFTEQSLFTDIHEEQREHCLQQAIIEIKSRFGKNSIIKGMSLLDKATAVKRNTLVGGHNAE